MEQIGFGIRDFLSVCTEMSLPIKTNHAGRGRNNIACQSGIFGQIQRNGSVKLVVTALQYQVVNFFLKCFGAGRLGYYCSKRRMQLFCETEKRAGYNCRSIVRIADIIQRVKKFVVPENETCCLGGVVIFHCNQDVVKLTCSFRKIFGDQFRSAEKYNSTVRIVCCQLKNLRGRFSYMKLIGINSQCFSLSKTD